MEENFLGNGSHELIENEFQTTTLLDYCLISGRPQTFIPKNTNVLVFGQLSNNRWRCLVQKEHLLQSLQSKNRLIDGSQSIRVKRKSLDLLENPDLMDYPLIGSVPTSVIYDLKKLDDKSITTETQLHGDNYIEQTLPTEEDIEASEEKIVDQNDDKKIPAAPYSSHPRGHAGRNRGLASLLGSQKDLSVDTTMSNGLRKHSSDELEDLNTSSQTLPTISSDTISLNSIPDSIKLSKSQSMDSLGDYESEQSEPESTVIPSRSNGIIIRKKLRQKGISIVVGSSSSSEGESDDDEIPPGKSSFERLPKVEEISENSSLSEMEGSQLTASTDFLYRFGNTSSPTNFAKPKRMPDKTPDINPPSNHRRTLKMSKVEDKGYGFVLQTYSFKNQSKEVKKRTFVQHVEEDGPAYVAGLREGDIIVEINGQEVENEDHGKVVKGIDESKKELVVVVKFSDAVRRAELDMELQQKEMDLRSKLYELWEIRCKERTIMGLDANLPRPCPHCFSKQTSDDDFLSLVLKGCFSNHTEDMSNSISDEISIWTSRFEIKKSLISDSVKHVKCDESQQQDSCTFRTHVTTGDDLLMAFSSTIHPDTKLSPQHRSRSMPIQCDTKPKLPENQNCSVRNNNDDTLVRCSSSPVVSETKDTTSESSRNGSIVKPSIRTIPVSQNRTNQSSHSLARNRRPKSYKIAVSTGGYNSGKGENTLVNVIETPETNM